MTDSTEVSGQAKSIRVGKSWLFCAVCRIVRFQQIVSWQNVIGKLWVGKSSFGKSLPTLIFYQIKKIKTEREWNCGKIEIKVYHKTLLNLATFSQEDNKIFFTFRTTSKQLTSFWIRTKFGIRMNWTSISTMSQVSYFYCFN